MLSRVQNVAFPLKSQIFHRDNNVSLKQKMFVIDTAEIKVKKTKIRLEIFWLKEMEATGISISKYNVSLWPVGLMFLPPRLS